MRQIFKTRHLLQLLFIYTALESFRHIGWMLFYEQLIDNTRQEINLGFILYSGSIMITALLIPLIFSRLHIENNEKKLRLIFISSICGALVFRILQIFSGVISAYVFLVLWTFAIMVGICICYIHIFKSVPRAMIGWFFGAAYCVDVLIVSFVEQFTGTPAYFNASVIVGVVLCFVSVLFYIRHSKTNEPNLNEEYEWKPSKRFVRSAWIALILYVLIAGTLDNLYFFDERISLPTLGVYELPMMGVMYLIGGFLFAKVKPQITIPLAFVAICIAQSMTFFATGSLFSFSYSALSYLGSTLLEIATVVIPIWYARMSGRSYCFASFGEGLFYGGFAISSIWFLFLKQSAYHPVMGGILLAAISCLGLLIILIIFHERDKHQKKMEAQKLEIDSLKQAMVTYPITSEELLLSTEKMDFNFTKREQELLPLIISSHTAEEIAQKANLSVSTVRFHIKNILGKTSAKNRRELMRMIHLGQDYNSEAQK